jgi:alkylated DNA repair protein alkB family protein 1
VEEDEVWLAGWWGPDVDGVWGGRKNPWKGKERERGERPELILNGLKEVRLTDGRLGWVVAEGE